MRLRARLFAVEGSVAALQLQIDEMARRLAQFPQPPRPGWIRVTGMATEPLPVEQLPFPQQAQEDSALAQLARIIQFPAQ